MCKLGVVGAYVGHQEYHPVAVHVHILECWRSGSSSSEAAVRRCDRGAVGLGGSCWTMVCQGGSEMGRLCLSLSLALPVTLR